MLGARHTRLSLSWQPLTHTAFAHRAHRIELRYYIARDADTRRQHHDAAAAAAAVAAATAMLIICKFENICMDAVNWRVPRAFM